MMKTKYNRWMGKIAWVVLFLVGINTPDFGQKSESLEPFTQIEAFGRMEFRLEKGTADSIQIDAKNADAEKVSYKVEDGILKIRLLTEFPPDIKVNVRIVCQSLQKISAGGGAKVYNWGTLTGNSLEILSKSGSEFDLLIKTDSVKAKVDKGAFLRLTGECPYVELATSTGGAYRATQLKNYTTIADMNGGTAEVSTDSLLDVTARFKASLLYLKPPVKLIKKEKFGGEVGILEP